MDSGPIGDLGDPAPQHVEPGFRKGEDTAAIQCQPLEAKYVRDLSERTETAVKFLAQVFVTGRVCAGRM